MFSCPNRGCSNAVVFDEEDCRDYITCPDCSTDLNSPAQLQQEEKENEEKLREYLATNDVRCCPKCRMGISRIAGCDHMRCSNCATRFCYNCGRHSDVQFPCPPVCVMPRNIDVLADPLVPPRNEAIDADTAELVGRVAENAIEIDDHDDENNAEVVETTVTLQDQNVYRYLRRENDMVYIVQNEPYIVHV